MMSGVLLYWLKLNFELHIEITPRQILKLDLGPMARNGVIRCGPFVMRT